MRVVSFTVSVAHRWFHYRSSSTSTWKTPSLMFEQLSTVSVSSSNGRTQHKQVLYSGLILRCFKMIASSYNIRAVADRHTIAFNSKHVETVKIGDRWVSNKSRHSTWNRFIEVQDISSDGWILRSDGLLFVRSSFTHSDALRRQTISTSALV